MRINESSGKGFVVFNFNLNTKERNNLMLSLCDFSITFLIVFKLIQSYQHVCTQKKFHQRFTCTQIVIEKTIHKGSH